MSAIADPKPRKRLEVRCSDCGEVRTLTYKLSSSILPKRCVPCAREYQRQRLLTGRWLDCSNCGTRFWRKQSYLAGRKPGRTLFCSTACLKEGGGYRELAREQSLARRGSGNPGFVHGRRVGVKIPGWGLGFKGESACRNCGSRERVQLHHVIPRAHSRAAKSDLRNGIPLWWSCHTGWHSRMVTIFRDVFTEEEWAFLSTVDLIDRSVTSWLDANYPVRVTA